MTQIQKFFGSFSFLFSGAISPEKACLKVWVELTCLCSYTTWLMILKAPLWRSSRRIRSTCKNLTNLKTTDSSVEQSKPREVSQWIQWNFYNSNPYNSNLPLTRTISLAPIATHPSIWLSITWNSLLLERFPIPRGYSSYREFTVQRLQMKHILCCVAICCSVNLIRPELQQTLTQFKSKYFACRMWTMHRQNPPSFLLFSV